MHDDIISCCFRGLSSLYLINQDTNRKSTKNSTRNSENGLVITKESVIGHLVSADEDSEAICDSIFPLDILTDLCESCFEIEIMEVFIDELLIINYFF